MAINFKGNFFNTTSTLVEVDPTKIIINKKIRSSKLLR